MEPKMKLKHFQLGDVRAAITIYIRSPINKINITKHSPLLWSKLILNSQIRCENILASYAAFVLMSLSASQLQTQAAKLVK